MRWAGRQRRGRVFLIGGAAQSAAYRRVVADLTGRPVLVPSEGELVAAGAAVQAAAVHLGCDFAQVERGLGTRCAASSSSPTTRSIARPSRAAYADAARSAAA